MSAPNDLLALERELAQLKEQLPAHSIPPSLLERIDELEEQIAALKTQEDVRASPKTSARQVQNVRGV